MFKTLEEMEAAAKPDPERHWILPGTVKAGIKLAIIGKECKAKQIIAADLAISATAFTKFVGAFEPQLAARTLYVTDDELATSTIFRKLLNGHRVKDPDDLELVYDTYGEELPSFWQDLVDEIETKKIKLVIVENNSSHSLPRNKVNTLINNGVTVVSIRDNDQNFFTQNEITVTQDITNNSIILSSPNSTIAHCKVYETVDSIKLVPLPPIELNRMEEEVWCALQQLGPTTVKSIKESIGNNNIAKENMIPIVLSNLKDRNIVNCEDQKGRAGIGGTKIWSVVMPER
jgi:hypothetical protein